MKHVGIFDYFDQIVSVDDANDVGKDRPDVFLLAAGRLGVVPEQCTVFEDLLVAMRSAKSVGMRVWAIHDDSSDGDWPDICGLAEACCLISARRRAVCEPTRNCYALDLDSCP
mgnify:CR=1 FL=1